MMDFVGIGKLELLLYTVVGYVYGEHLLVEPPAREPTVLLR